MPVGCTWKRRDGMQCQREAGHGGACRFKPYVKSPVTKVVREDLTLLCSQCGGRLPYRGFRDPEQGEGWPLHRCAPGKVITFDGVETATPVKQKRYAPRSNAS